MADENKESKQEVVDKTTNQNAPTDETKTEEKKADTPENPEDEKVTLSKKEFEDLSKRADDFNKSIELKRLNKLAEKGELKTDLGDDVKDEIAKLRDEISAFKANTYNSNLTEAYRQFVAEHPWANDDAKFDKIKESFNSVGTETKDELFSKLKSAAQMAFPTEYEKHLEEKIKANLFKDKSNLNSNGAAGAATNLHTDNKEKTAEEKQKERLAGLFNQHFSTRR